MKSKRKFLVRSVLVGLIMDIEMHSLSHRSQIVTEHSATLNCPGELVYPAHADHREISKFSHPSNQTYRTITQYLLKTFPELIR